MPSSPAPQLRFICESPSDASNHPHGSSAKPAYLIKADALRNYCANGVRVTIVVLRTWNLAICDGMLGYRWAHRSTHSPSALTSGI
jgi:hypothetical protein